MSLFEADRKNLLGSEGNSNGQPRPLKQILESHIDKINEGYTPQEKPWQQAVSGSAKSHSGRPLMTILSEGLDEINQGHKPSYDPHEAVKGLQRASYKPLVMLAQNQAGGGAGEGYGRRVGNSLHTGDTWGANNTFHNVQTDPHAQDMNRRMLYGEDSEKAVAHLKASARLPHVQVMAPVVGGFFHGVAETATPFVEMEAQTFNALYGETEPGKALADFGEKTKGLEYAIEQMENNSPLLTQNGKPTTLGRAVSQTGKLARAAPGAIRDYYAPGLGVASTLYNAGKKGQRVYNQTLADQETAQRLSGEKRHREEMKSEAFQEGLLSGIADAAAGLPGHYVEKATGANTDWAVTNIMQKTVLDQGRPASQEMIKRMLEELIQSSEWDMDHF